MANYWDDPQLKLYYKSKSDHSIDDEGAKRYGKTATVTGNFVSAVQQDLIKIGYLDGKADGDFGLKTQHAVIRFQRRAKTQYRIKPGGAAADTSVTYLGQVSGTVDYDTAKELRLWIQNTLMAPLGRFKLVGIPGGKLRSDAAGIWNGVAAKIKASGGTTASPYGDTLRAASFRKSTGGNSLYSLHYTGRAVDLNQGLAGGKNQKYYVVKETVGAHTYWRVYCKTDVKKGNHIKQFTKLNRIKYYVFYSKKEVDIPDGYYLDITAVLDSVGFIRIKAHSNWKTNSKGMEWWHFHYDKNLQATFQDEMELIGYDEKTLRQNGWSTYAKLDRKPG